MEVAGLQLGREGGIGKARCWAVAAVLGAL
eukprot:SAG31_NODE_24652_length_477_cov_0.679894_1_plen_29_part_10